MQYFKSVFNQALFSVPYTVRWAQGHPANDHQMSSYADILFRTQSSYFVISTEKPKTEKLQSILEIMFDIK